jgi:hypothetical protein
MLNHIPVHKLPILTPALEANEWLGAFIDQLASDPELEFSEFSTNLTDVLTPIIADLHRHNALDLDFEFRQVWFAHHRTLPSAKTFDGEADRESYHAILTRFLDETRDPDPRRRRLALKDLCPCHIKADVPEFWDRICTMTQDSDAGVRYQALHNLCDGSPRWREEAVIAAVSNLVGDPDREVRRTSHRILAMYRKTGRWNFM